MENTELTMFAETIKYSGNQIWVRPVCDFFKLDVQNQYIKIKKDPILGKLYGKNRTDSSENGNLYGKNLPDSSKNGNLVGKNKPDLGEIDKNGRILLAKKGFIQWIQIINVNTIIEELREKFLLYQSLVIDYIYGSFEREELMKVDYLRLKKLKRLYSVIGREIQRVDDRVRLYMDSRFSQLNLPLDDTR